MTTLNALPDLLPHLKGYGEGGQLKKEAMQEVEQVLAELKLSRRQFLKEAAQLGFSVTTVTSLGNWISCKYMPTAQHVDRLLEALDTALLNRGKIKISPEKLRESSALQEQSLHRFRQEVQDVDQAIVGLEDTLSWLTLSEFPPVASLFSHSFIPITRQHGIERLKILYEVHEQAVEATLLPQSLPHALLVAKTAIILSHFLLEIGQAEEAFTQADEGTYLLADILARMPHLREDKVVAYSPVISYSQVPLADLEIFGYLRRGNALATLASQARHPAKRAELITFAGAAYQTALEKVEHAPDRERLKPGIVREIAALRIQTSTNGSDYEEAERLARQAATAYHHMAVPDDPLLYYLCQVTLSRALIARSKFAEAAEALQEARAAEVYGREQRWVLPGPLHQVMLLRTEASYYLARIQSEGRNSSTSKLLKEAWQQKMVESLELARSVDLKDQVWKIEQTIRGLDKEFRQLVLNKVQD